MSTEEPTDTLLADFPTVDPPPAGDEAPTDSEGPEQPNSPKEPLPPINLPLTFLDKCFWPTDAPLPNPITFPPTVIPQAVATIAPRFDSQHQSQEEKSNEEVISLFCPQTSSSVLIDAAVRKIAKQLNADVVVLDALDLMAAEDGPFGKEMSEVIGALYQKSKKDPEHSDDDDEPHERLFHAIVTVNHASNSVSAPSYNYERPVGRRRIIYLRNHRRIAKVSLPLLNALICAIQRARRGSTPESYIGVVHPTVIIRGVPGHQTASARAEECANIGKGYYDAAVAKDHIPRTYVSLGVIFRTSWVYGSNHWSLKEGNQASDWTRDACVEPIYVDTSSAQIRERIQEGEKVANEELKVAKLESLVGEFFKGEVIHRGGKVAEDEDPSAIIKEWAKLDPETATELVPALEEDDEVPLDKESLKAVIKFARDATSLHTDDSDRARDIGQMAYALGCAAPDMPLTSVDFARATKLASLESIAREKWSKAQVKTPNNGTDEKEGEDEKKEEAKAEKEIGDPVITRVKESELNEYEKRLLPSIVDTTLLSTTFDQVCVSDDIIEGLRTMVSLPILHPEAFRTGLLKNEGMAGVLLYGPPGTGKTMLCRALAKECGARMLQVAPSDINDMWVGETEKLVRALFSLARKLGPCVIFIDEIDALFRSRGQRTGGVHREMLTEFMQEMDGLRTAGQNRASNIVVVGATNCPQDLDDAVLRRLPRRMLVDLPGQAARQRILEMYLKDETLAEDVDIPTIALRTNIFSGSDLKHLCVAAALAAFKDTIPTDWAKLPQGHDINSAKTITVATTETATTTAVSTTEDSTAVTSTPDVPAETPALAKMELGPRVIRNDHIDIALSEVGASSSENMESVRTLRAWSTTLGRGRSA